MAQREQGAQAERSPAQHDSSAPAAGRQRALVYAGEGAGTRSVLSALESLRAALPPDARVESFAEAELLEGAWLADCTLLVLPGGADLPYCRQLNGGGNRLIRRYVEGGGAYLGLCAGAYYACRRVEFEWRDCGGGRLEVVGERELAFFPGVARGSAFPGFQYETEAGAVAAGLRFRAPHTCPAPACEALPGRADSAGQPSGDAGAGGSPLRLPPAAAHVREAVTPPVAQSCTSEAGALPHAARTREPGSEPLARHAGAGAPAAAPARRGAACAAEEACDDGWVLVSREDALPGPRAALECAGGRVEGASEGPAAQRARDAAPGAWERCVDYCNGGPMFCAERGARGQDSGFSPGFAVLAEYAELGGAPAAVRCRVGAGRAVLVGTHPELAPHWLDAACAPGGPTGEGRGGGAAPVLQARAAGVREALAAGAASRRRLWRMLLSEAGMHGLRI